jgi:hypothetical protein
MTKATRTVKSFNFDFEGAHVALVDKAANGQSVLVMKSLTASEAEIKKALSKDVTVKMDIMEFLTRYINLGYGDAEVVAGLLGYTAEDIDKPPENSASSWVEHIQREIDSVQINKSEHTEKLNEKLEAFAAKYLEKNLLSSVEGGNATLEDEDVVTKAEDDKSTKQEVGKQMPDKNEELTQKSVEAMVQKAAADLAKEQVEAIEKSYAAKAEESNKELQVLKAAHETRTHQEYVAKASEYVSLLGEDADVEGIAKALRAVEGLEEAAPLMDVLKALKKAAGQDDLLVEVGKSATEEQPSDIDSQAIAVAKSLRESDPSLTQRQAEMKAYEQLVSQA